MHRTWQRVTSSKSAVSYLKPTSQFHKLRAICGETNITSGQGKICIKKYNENPKRISNILFVPSLKKSLLLVDSFAKNKNKKTKKTNKQNVITTKP